MSTLTPEHAAAPAKKSHTVRNVILILLGVGTLLVGGCAVVAVGVLGGTAAVLNEVDKSIKEDANKQGGTDNPMTITEGNGFEVDGFVYADGWSLNQETFGYVTAKGLEVTNNRDDKDSAIVEIKLWQGKKVAASIDCSTEPILPGTATKVDCMALDKMPKTYDKVTINDTF